MTVLRGKEPLYLDSGYLNIGRVLSYDTPFILCVGGRGTGKTFGALKHCRENAQRFLYLRRTKAEIESVTTKENHVFRPHNMKYDWSIEPHPLINGMVEWFDNESNQVIGLGAALSTFANIRGVGLDDVEVIIYDEFIPELRARPIKDEANAVFNMVESVNRNRELEGKPPVTLLCLANSNDLANPLFIALSIVTLAEKMIATGKEIEIIHERGLALFCLQRSPISEKKRETALYKLTAGSGFAEMALDNVFTANKERSDIRSLPLIEFSALFTVGEITVYRHKSKDLLYCCTHASGARRKYGTGETELARLRRHEMHAWWSYLRREMTFETYYCEILFVKAFKN